ncbi:hypothetical protein BGZ73_003367 [Actinomortierella ambigua]|nr:hypothetical protein BGZ73_003367 [Actinomortierella ambigua]
MLLKKSLLVLCTAAVAMAASDFFAVSSGALFIGKDTTDPDATPTEIFHDPQNHAAAASSVLKYSGTTTGFDPSSVLSKALGASLVQFLQSFSTFPGATLVQSEESTLPLNGDLIQLEAAVRHTTKQHAVLIGRSVRDLVPGYILDKTLKYWALLLTVIEKPDDSDQVSVTFVRLNLEINVDKDHSAVIPKQQAKINTSVFQLNQQFLIQYADQLAAKIQISKVPETIDFLTSLKDPSGGHNGAEGSCHKWLSGFGVREKQRILNW